jgi:hypothetical protein
MSINYLYKFQILVKLWQGKIDGMNAFKGELKCLNRFKFYGSKSSIGQLI